MSRRHVLYLEDDEMMPELVTALMERSGPGIELEVVRERDGFLRACERGGHDLVLSDHEVPGMPGLHALQEVRRRRPDVPFVFVCGAGGAERERICFEAGADDFVRKDQLSRLPIVVERLLSTAARERRAREVVRDAEALELLVRAVKDLSMARSVEQIAGVVRAAARRLNGADGATFVLRDGDLCHYFDEDAIAPLWKGRRFPQSACISGWVMRHGTHAAIEDIFADPRIPADAYRPTFVKSLVMVPVRAEMPIAAIGNYWARSHRATPREIELIQVLADATSVAMENVAVYTELERRVRARTAELALANKELEAYSYSVSHDLRTPVGQVIGFGDLLAEDLGATATEKQRRFVGNILSAARRANELIDDLLTLARISQAELMRSRVDLALLAQQVIDGLTVGHRSVEWRIVDSLIVDADERLMRIVFENLLSNALKYTSKQARAVIEIGRGDVTDDQVGVFVRDNGAGFDPRQADRLFTPFGRLHSAQEFPGNGVGLATCQRILHRHDGRLWAESSVGSGATFHFSLPALRR